MALNVALDTNAYTALMRGAPAVVRVVRSASRVFMPFVVLAELKAGFAAGRRQTSNAANLSRFLATSRVSVLLPDEETADHYADVFVYLRRIATPIPVNDMWIAALVIQHKLMLSSSDRHLDHLPHVPRC